MSKASMTKLEALQPWLGTLLAFFVVFMNFGHADAATQIAFATPMCVFFVSAAVYLTGKRVAKLQTQIDELRRSIGRRDEAGDS
jgi:Sec-independent protein secretion pathway component TatC